MARMLGPSCHFGPGGRDCACCNVPPGRARKEYRRHAKRGERNRLKRMIDLE